MSTVVAVPLAAADRLHEQKLQMVQKIHKMAIYDDDADYRSVFAFGNDNRKYEAILTSAESDIQN